MESSRNNADRVRPILAAMERSIEAARRKRTNGPGEQPAPAPRSQPARSVPDAEAPTSPSASENNGEKPDFARMKARPKRPSHFNDSPQTYRSAG